MYTCTYLDLFFILILTGPGSPGGNLGPGPGAGRCPGPGFCNFINKKLFKFYLYQV